MLEEDKEESNPRSKVGWWLRWIKCAKKAAATHWKDAKAAYSEYERMGREGGNESEYSTYVRAYPIYHFSCKILESAYYAKTPKVRSSRKHGIEDEMALTMSLIVDRLGQNLIDQGNFDQTIRAAVQDYIHAAKTTTQVVYTTDLEATRMPLILEGENESNGIYKKIDSDEVYEGEVKKDSNGYFYEDNRPLEASQKVFLSPCLYDEILHTPHAKSQMEITEKAYRFCMDYEEAERRFNTNPDGTKKGLSLPYSTGKLYKDGEDENYSDSMDLPGKQLEGWECYCKHTKTVYWVSEEYPDSFLAQAKDPYEFADFFPSPAFIISNKHRKSLFATPAFVYLESTCNQLHESYYRARRLADAVKRKALVYGLSVEVVAALNKIEGEEFVLVGDLQEILEKGGIERYIQYLPVRELVDSLSECLRIEEHFKQNFYEWFRLPDILRGTSDPSDSLGAQEIKSDAANDSFRYDKKQIVDLCRDSAELMLDMALKVYSDEKIARICGWEFMESGDPGSPPSQENPAGVPPKLGHKERFFEALARLRNDSERLVRIDFETDSSSFRDEAREIERQKMISSTVIQGLQMLGGIQNPEFSRIALKLLLSVVESMGGSAESEDMIKSAASDLEKSRNAPPPPPPPDYEAMKIQIKAQENEIRANKNALDAQNKTRQLEQREFEFYLEQQQQNFDQQMELSKATQERSDREFENNLKVFEAKLEQALVAIEQQRVQIEDYRAQIQGQESMLEEVRLAREASSNAAEKIAQFLSTSTPKAEPVPPITNVFVDAKPQPMQSEMIRDELGNLIGTRQTPIVDKL